MNYSVSLICIIFFFIINNVHLETEVPSKTSELASKTLQLPSKTTELAPNSKELTPETTKLPSKISELPTETLQLPLTTQTTEFAPKISELVSNTSEFAPKISELVSNTSESAPKISEFPSETLLPSKTTKLPSKNSELLLETVPLPPKISNLTLETLQKRANLDPQLELLVGCQNERFNSTYGIIPESRAAILYPYLVSILFDNVHLCDGTIIAPKWILSAAHCLVTNEVINVDPHTVPSSCSVIRGGSILNNGPDNPEYRSCKAIFTNPWYMKQYNASSKEPEDIGLILLNKPYDTNNIIKLGKFDDIEKAVLSNNTCCTIMNYDREVGEDGNTSNIVLTVAKVRLVRWVDCRKPDINELKEICVLEIGKHVNKGSSGGPLVCNKTQYALASRGSGEVNTLGDITQYTRLDFYDTWIQKQMLSANVRLNQSFLLIVVIMFLYFTVL